MLEKINWDSYFMAQAFLIAQKSIDPSTKHGSVLVDKNNRILSVGYNGPLRNIDDTQIPLTRPEKYLHLLHSEENCLLSYYGEEERIVGSRMYITGMPCHKCLRMMIQKGIFTIIYGNVVSFCVKEEGEEQARKLMLELNPQVRLIEFNNNSKIIELLNITIEYVDQRATKENT